MSRKMFVDAEKLLELVDQLRVAVPQGVSEAEEVLRKRDELLNQSLGEARRIRASAEDEFRSRVDDNELIQEAQKQSNKLMEEAQGKAQRILDTADSDADTRRTSADQYSQEVLYKLEQEVAELLGTVRNGIEVLESRQSAVSS
jgi:cell division septum initiation protein DivIVA